MPGVKVLLKGMNKVIEFPENVAMQEIEKAIKGNWDSVSEIKGLPMDKKSAANRAEYLGFDTKNTVYHGTRNDFESFATDKPSYFAPDPSLANTFAKMGGTEGGMIIPARIKVKNTFDYTNEDHIEALKRSIGNDKDTENAIKGVIDGKYEQIEDKKTIDAIKRAGFDSFFVREKPEKIAFMHADKIKSSLFPDTAEGKKEAMEFYKQQLEPWSKYGEKRAYLKPVVQKADNGFYVEHIGNTFDQSKLPEEAKSELKRNIAVFDQRNIRSVNAAFDPSKKDSTSLLAGLGPLGIGMAALSPEEASAQTASQLMPSSNMLLSIDQLNKLPSHMRPDVGSIQGPIKGDSDVVAAIQDLGGLLSKFEVPVLGNPVQGLADYMQNFGYNDSEKERLKRAAMAVLDFL